jgi:fatty-acyl-CoA synthase
MKEKTLPIEGYWINNWISRHADINSDQLILIDEKSGDRLTYKTFNERVERIAAFLKNELNLRKGDRVAIVSWNRIEMLTTLFASAKLGCIFVPINTRYTAKEIEDYNKIFEPKVLMYEEQFANEIEKFKSSVKIAHYIHIDGEGLEDSLSFQEAEKYSKKLVRAESVALESPLMILQTGGTTGVPKGSIVTYRMVLWNAFVTVRDLVMPGEVTVTCVPLFHIGGYTYTIPLLIWGGTNILMYRWNPEGLIDWIEKEEVTFQFLVPAQLKMLTESDRFNTADFSSVRWFTTGGGALTKEIVNAFLKKGVTMKQGYGLTEVGPGVFALDPKDAFRKIGSIGKPNLLIDVKVIDEKGRDVGLNKPGELLIRAPSMFGGYWNNPKETMEAVKGGWLHTGDIVKCDEEGYFYIIGRKKHLIRSGSESIYPEEVENVLISHPKIQDVAVIGVPDEKWGEMPKALIVVKKGEKITNEELIEYCKDKLSKYKIPKIIDFVETLPKTSAGKILRKKLVERYRIK